jgi:hypothetical protein
VKPDLSRAQWRKSSYSGNSGNCVEVAALSGIVAVRDSKNADHLRLQFTSDSWHAFILRLKTTMHDL